MCGIVAYAGKTSAVPVLVDGLQRLEYRGYDSSGIATLTGSTLNIRKAVGHICQLRSLLVRHPIDGTIGVSHTRWATHGTVTTQNAHPHSDQSGRLALVHNGVIENYRELRDDLIG